MSDLLDHAIDVAKQLPPHVQDDMAQAILALAENLSQPGLDFTPSGPEPTEDEILALMPTVMPSAVPTKTEVAAWNRLSDAEQVERMRAILAHPDCNAVSPHTMDDILAEARRRSANRHRV